MTFARLRVARRHHREPVDLRRARLPVGVHHLAHPVRVGRGVVDPAALELLAAGPGHREALVGADEDDHGVGMVAGDLGRRELPPVGDRGPGDGGAEVGVADHVDAVRRQPPGQLGVERGRERVAGDEQRVQRLLRRRGRADLGGVEVVRRHRRDPARAAGGRGCGLVEAAAAELLVGGEPAGELVLSSTQRQAVGDPLGRLADGVDDVVPDPGVDLRGRVADRAAGEQDQEQGDERDRADRVAGRVGVLPVPLEAAHLAVVAMLCQRPCPIRTGSR